MDLLKLFEYKTLKKHKRLILFLADIFLSFLGCFVTQLILEWTRVGHRTTLFSGGIFLRNWLLYLGTLCVCLTVFRFACRLYHSIWRYPTTRAYVKLMAADFLSGLFAWVISVLADYSVGLASAALTSAAVLLLTLLSRYVYRLLYNHRSMLSSAAAKDHRLGVAIVGAGQVGVLLAKELKHDANARYMPHCFIDKDPQKAGNRVMDLPVYLENDAVLERLAAMPVREIFIALPERSAEETEKLFLFYKKTGLPVKLYDFPVKNSVSDKTQPRRLREFKIEDLLFRNSKDFAGEETKAFCENKVILVTGGGGSIGSELCRQIAKCNPKQLIVFDIYENNAYELEQELKREDPSLDLIVEIGSVRDAERLEAVFAYYRPQIVFHAAAHKHVPLMEHSNCEAIKNNVFGTYNTANMAEKYGVEKFTLVSTDKAVNPTNVMGATKRMCEMVIQCRTDSKTTFAAVRFGNVLGSNGSVIPLFKRQIQNGGPVTITDKRIIRYFMTIPEASQLVMQAGALAKNGELFVLDMGKPVEILKLAENMIRLSGYEPYVDIDIQEIGLRPGEKLYEELLMESETRTQTSNKMIFIERDTPLRREEVEEKLQVLRNALNAHKDEIGAFGIRDALKSVVPTYRDAAEVNAQSESIRRQQLS